MPDSQCKECYDCSEKFTTFRRRHHCRLCGQIFCSRCCNQEIPGKFMGYTGRVYLLRNRTVSMCSDLHLRYWHLLENTVQVHSGLKNKEKESQDLLLPVSLWTVVDYAMPAYFYHTTKQIWPLFNKGVHYRRKCARGKGALSNSSFKIWAACFNWGWGESLSNTSSQILDISWCVSSDWLLFCHHFSGHMCSPSLPPSLFLSFSLSPLSLILCYASSALEKFPECVITQGFAL